MWYKIKNFENYEISIVDGSIRKGDKIVPIRVYHNSETINLVKDGRSFQKKPYLLYYQTFGKSIYPAIPNLDNEVWKPIPNHHNYQASNLGRIKNNITEKLLPYSDNGNGYMRVTLDGKVYYVHRIIAETFLSNPDNKPQIDHINTNRSDNTAVNLRFVSVEENMNNPRTKQNRFENKCGFRLKNSTLEKWVCELDMDGNFINLWKSSTDASKHYKVVHSAIINCLKGCSSSSCGKKWCYFSEIPTSALIAFASLD